jgi:hypothetical protein
MQPHDLVPVYSAWNSFKAEIIKNMLEEEGIRAFVQSENQGAFDGSLMVEVKVLVEDSRAEDARKLIEEREEQVIADSLADMEHGEDESDNEPENENPTPTP